MTSVPNNYSVVTLYDNTGAVAGYAVSPPGATTAVQSTGWTASSVTGTALGALQTALVAVVEDARQVAEYGGVVDQNGNVFTTDTASQVKYAAILAYVTLNPGYSGTWNTVNNGSVTLNASGISVLCEIVLTYVQYCFAWQVAITAEINAATTVAQLQAVDITTGRPAGALPSPYLAAIVASGGARGSGGLAGTSLTSSGSVIALKFQGTAASPPTLVGGSGSGTAGIVGLTSGSSDCAGQINVSAAGTVAATTSSVIVTLTFNTAYTTMPFVSLTAANMAAGNLVNLPYVTTTATAFQLCVANNSALSAGSTYMFNYHVVQ